MTWLFITIIAYLLFALANVGDKMMVSHYKTQPIVYAFYVGFLGLLSLLLVPFGVGLAGPNVLYWAAFAGTSFVLTLLFMYKAINAGETTRAITLMGGTSPVFTLLFAYLFLGERLTIYQGVAFIFLVLAIIIISWPIQSHRKIHLEQLFWGCLAGLAAATSYVLTKHVYSQEAFIAGFFWIRMGGVVTSLVILLIPSYRQLIKIDWAKPKKKRGALVGLIQVVGGLGVVGQNYAFALASATLVNALQAVQYAFVFFLTAVLGYRFPILRENYNYKIIIQKLIAIALICCGLYFLAFQ